MGIDDVSPEVLERAKACTTAEELLELVKETGVDISDDQLATIASGGYCFVDDCGGFNLQLPD